MAMNSLPSAGSTIATPRAWVELFSSGPELSLAAAVQAADGAKQ